MAEISRISPGEEIARDDSEIIALKAEALSFYNQTEFPILLKKYALVVSGEIIEGESNLRKNQDSQSIYWPVKQDSIMVSVFWQKTRLTTGGFEHWHNAVGLEVFPNGAVSVHGGIGLDQDSSPGSSFLTVKELRNNRVLQERSLKKAFEIPFVTWYEKGSFEESTVLH